MPIRIDYSPVGLAATLAIRAGQAESARSTANLGVQLQQLSNQRAAQMDRAEESMRQDSLQRAQMDRQAEIQRKAFDIQKAAGMRTPAADLVAQQLKSMRSSGAITPEQFDQANLAHLSGNDPMMRDIMGTNPPAVKEDSVGLGMVRQPFGDKRRELQSKLNSLNRALTEELPYMNDSQITELKNQIPAVQNEIAQLNTAEKNAVQQFRMQASGTRAAETGSVSPMTSRSYPAGWNTTERAIFDQVQARNPSTDFTIRGEQARNTTFGLGGRTAAPTASSRTKPPPIPPPEQRVVGDKYTIPDGRVIIWRAGGGELAQ